MATRGPQIAGLMDCKINNTGTFRDWAMEVPFELPSSLSVRVRNDFAPGKQVIVGSVAKTPGGFVRMFSEPMLASDFLGANQDGSSGCTQNYNPANPSERLQQIAFYEVLP